MEWKPYRELSPIRFVLAFVAAVAAIGAIALAIHGERVAARALDRVASLPHASLRAPVRGPAVYTGTLTAPSGRLTGMNLPSAAYAGWVTETTGSGKNQTTRRVCDLSGEIDGLSLRDGDTTIALTLFPTLGDATVLESDDALSPQRHRGVFDFGDPRHYSSIPGGLIERCSLSLNRGSLNYYELSIAPESPVTVVACFDGSALGRCPDGNEIIARGSLHRVGDAWASTMIIPVRVFGFMVLTALAIVAATTAGKAVRLDRAARRSV